MENAIVIRQLPVIEERLAALSERIGRDVAEALAMEVTEENRKRAKDLRARLNKDYKLLEAMRVKVKKEVMAPYEAFEETYREMVADRYAEAFDAIDARVGEIEGGLARQKRGELEAYYDELCGSVGLDFVPFDRWGPKVGLSSSLKALKEQASGFISGIVDCRDAIADMEHADEIMAEFKKSLSLPAAMQAAADRRAAIEEEKRAREEAAAGKRAEAEAIAKVDAALPRPRTEAASAAEAKQDGSAEKDPDELIRVSYVLSRRDIRRASKLFEQNGIKPEHIRWEVYHEH